MLWLLCSARCSQVLPGFENLLFAHSSWYTYAATMRIYKHWDFSVAEPRTATGKLSFSSYPGVYGRTLRRFSFCCDHAERKNKHTHTFGNYEVLFFII